MEGSVAMRQTPQPTLTMSTFSGRAEEFEKSQSAAGQTTRESPFDLSHRRTVDRSISVFLIGKVDPESLPFPRSPD